MKTKFLFLILPLLAAALAALIIMQTEERMTPAQIRERIIAEYANQ
jgi:hypothetical protein